MRGCCGKEGEFPDVDLPDNLPLIGPASRPVSSISEHTSHLKEDETRLSANLAQKAPKRNGNKELLISMGIFPFTRVVMETQIYAGECSADQCYERVQAEISKEPSLLDVCVEESVTVNSREQQLSATDSEKKKKLEIEIEDDVPLPSQNRVIRTPRPQRPSGSAHRGTESNVLEPSLEPKSQQKDFLRINKDNIKNGKFLVRTPIRKKKPELLWNLKDSGQQTEAEVVNSDASENAEAIEEQDTDDKNEAFEPRRNVRREKSTTDRENPLELGDLVLSKKFEQQPIRAKLEERKLFVALEDDLQIAHYE